jgi:hypothetical protein
MRFALLILAATLLPAFTAEAVKLGIQKEDSWPQCLRGDAIIGYRLKSHCSEWLVRAGHRYFVSANAQGLRDKDYSPLPKKSVTRILLLGPSRLAAPGLDEKDGPVRKYEAALRKRGLKVEVINGGVDGYAAVQTAMEMRELISAYSPNAVIFAPFFTLMRDLDSYETSVYNEENAPVLYGGTKRVIQSLPRFLQPWATRNQWTTDAILHSYLRLKDSWLCKIEDLFKERGECLAKGSLASVEFMKALAETKKIKFIVALNKSGIYGNDLLFLPQHPQTLISIFDFFTPRLLYSEDFLERSLKARNVNFVLLGEEKPEHRIVGDQHYSELGAKFFATELAEKTAPYLKK